MGEDAGTVEFYLIVGHFTAGEKHVRALTGKNVEQINKYPHPDRFLHLHSQTLRADRV